MDASRLEAPRMVPRKTPAASTVPLPESPGRSRAGGVALVLGGLALISLSFIPAFTEGGSSLSGASSPALISSLSGAKLGTSGPDVLYGGPDGEVIFAGAGDDSVEVAGGGSDRVFCGSGRDLVHADGTDHVSRSCETVYRTYAPKDPEERRPRAPGA